MNDIANNIVAFMCDKEELSSEATSFICNWVLTDGAEKTKKMYDTWDIILKNYLPKERPIIFRACSRISKREIQSFTGSIRCAEKFSDRHRGHLLICDTSEYLLYENGMDTNPPYKYSFFPIYDLVKKSLDSKNPQFTEQFFESYSGEDEYILRVNIDKLYDLKWNKSKD